MQTALDVIAMAERPVVITHGNVQALNDNPRCSPDAVIEGVARTGGLMGVAALSEFMTWGRKDAAKAETGPFPANTTSLKLQLAWLDRRGLVQIQEWRT